MPQQHRQQIGQVAGEGEGVEAHQHHRAEPVESRRFVDQEQHRDQDQEEDRGEARAALHVEEDVGVEQRTEQEVQQRLGPLPGPLQPRRRLPALALQIEHRREEQAGDAQVGRLLDQHRRLVDAADHHRVEGKAADEEDDRLLARVAGPQGAEPPPQPRGSGVAVVSPGMGGVAVAAGLPEAGSVMGEELDPTDPLASLPGVELGSDHPHRSAVLAG